MTMSPDTSRSFSVIWAWHPATCLALYNRNSQIPTHSISALKKVVPLPSAGTRA